MHSKGCFFIFEEIKKIKPNNEKLKQNSQSKRQNLKI